MSITAIISGIIALAKALPIIDGWLKQLAQAYFEAKLAAHDKEFVDATRALIADHDQRDLEQAASGHTSLPAQDQSEVHRRPGSN